MNDGAVETFVRWAQDNLDAIRHLPSQRVADDIAGQLLKVSGQLGVEVGDDSENDRKVIVTAFSDSEMFELVRVLVTRLSGIPNWKFVALKPPRGFDFSLTLGDHTIQAGSIEFSPIEGIEGGIRLLLPQEVFESVLSIDNSEELAWLIVETGIGEELAAWLQHIEFGGVDHAESAWPISRLASFLNKSLEDQTTYT